MHVLCQSNSAAKLIRQVSTPTGHNQLLKFRYTNVHQGRHTCSLIYARHLRWRHESYCAHNIMLTFYCFKKCLNKLVQILLHVKFLSPNWFMLWQIPWKKLLLIISWIVTNVTKMLKLKLENVGWRYKPQPTFLGLLPFPFWQNKPALCFPYTSNKGKFITYVMKLECPLRKT